MSAIRRRAAASAIALAVVTGTAAITAPAAFAAVETETTTPAPVESTTPVDFTGENAVFTAEKTTLTSSELADSGIKLTVENVEPGSEVTFSINFGGTDPKGNMLTQKVTADAQGIAVAIFTELPNGATTGMVYANAYQNGEHLGHADIQVVADDSATQTPAPTETDEAPAEGIKVGQDVYTVAETVDGIEWAAAGLTPGEGYTVELVYPDGTAYEVPPAAGNDQIATDEGFASGTITRTVNGAPAAFETEGTYTIRVIQGELVFEQTFVIGTASEVPGDDENTDDATETTPAGDTDKDGNPVAGSDKGTDKSGTSNGTQLAQTGADDNMGIVLGAGLVLVAAGAGLVVARRRNA